MLVTRVSEMLVDGFSFSRFRRTYRRMKTREESVHQEASHEEEAKGISELDVALLHVTIAQRQRLEA